MNKLTKFFLLPIFIISLGGCFSTSDKLPTTNYEKVKFAFDGVEKSFSNLSNNRRDKQFRVGGSSEETGLTRLFSLFTSSDKKGSTIEDLEYSTPPMIQFQYLKKVFEKVGDNYSFGTKYFDTMYGDVYLDIETGYKATGIEHKYSYEFVLGMDINIDSNDLINADVSSDIKLSRTNEEYHTKWYVGLLLDYDMKSNSPNYTLSLNNENDERQLPYYNHFIYEYDYVSVSNNSINEWRKFCLESDRRLTKDASHQSFDAYINENIEYKVGCFAWYKDRSFYKNNELDSSKKATFASSLFNDLGINSTEMDVDRFFLKEGVRNSVIKTCYEDFSQIYGEDIIYDLVTTSEGHHSDTRVITSIKAMNEQLSDEAKNYLVPDISFRELFNVFIDGYGNRTVVSLQYIDQNGNIYEPVRNLESLDYTFKISGTSYETKVNLDESISDAYSKLMEQYVNRDEELRVFEVHFASKEYQNVKGRTYFIYVGELPEPHEEQVFPKELSDMGVPSYEGEDINYSYKEEGDKKYLEIGNTGDEEWNAYISLLLESGFKEYIEILVENGVCVVKEVNEEVNLFITIEISKIDGSVLLTVWNESRQDVFEVNAVSIVGDFNNWDVTTNCIEFTNVDENRFLLSNVYLDMGDKFKIIVNHSWDYNGGFGYYDVTRIDEYNMFEPKDDDCNIYVNQACYATFEANIDGENVLINLIDASLAE